MDADAIKRGLESRLEDSGDINYRMLTEFGGVISRIISALLGVLAVVILIIIPFVVALEITYICFPAFRYAEDKIETRLETKKVSKKIIGFALRDAKKVVSAVDINCGGTGDMLFLYARIKIKAIVLAVFALTIVLNGATFVVDRAWNMVGNIVEAIFG